MSEHTAEPAVAPSPSEPADPARPVPALPPREASGPVRSAAAGTAALDRLSALAARLLGTPAAMVALLDEVHTIVAGTGLPPGGVGLQSPPEESLCLVAVEHGGPLAVPDATADPRVSALSVVRDGRVGSYLGVPLYGESGAPLGTMCVFDTAPRSWTDAEIGVLEQLAASARAELALAALTKDYETERTRWELAVEVSELGYFDWDLRSGELTWDDRLISLYGYDVGDVGFDRSIDSVFARLHPEDSDRVGATMSAAIEAVGPIRIVYRIVLPTGATRWLEARGRAVPGPDGVAARLLGISWDVTEREVQEYRADRVLAAMPMGYLSMDADWRILHVNVEGARMAQSVPGDMIGEVLWDLHPVLLGTDFELVYRRVAVTGVQETVEAYYPEPLNIWFEVRVTADDGGVSLYYLDVTERRTAQLALDERAENDRTIAQALQHALLTRLPDVPGFELASGYVTASDSGQVGGDWYDAVVQPDGTLLAVIGDVVGHDIDAAATMGQLRSMLRMVAWRSQEPPSLVIAGLEEAAAAMGIGSLATLVTAMVGPRGEGIGALPVRWSNAGHPPPVLVHRDGTTELLGAGAPDLLLGVLPGAARRDHECELEPGATLVLYTDGLVETRTSDIDDGIERLRGVLARHHVLAAEPMVEAVLHDLVGEHPADDTALLVVRACG